MSSNNNNNNQHPLDIASLPVATQGLSMEDRDGLVKELEVCATRGQNRGNQRPPSICKVSRILRDDNKSSYEPQLVSIGPIHRENKKLEEFELLKECYLDDLLHRSNSTPKKTLEAFLLEVNTLIPQIRESYAGMIENYSDVDLARMMVMDGCFILEFCFKHHDRNLYLPNKMQNTRIAMDLMLLENQVPFSVLQALFDCSMGKVSLTLSSVLDEYLAPYIQVFGSPLPEKNSILTNVLEKYLAPYIIKLFRSLLPEYFSTTDVASDLPKKFSTTHDHVLGYMHNHYQPVGAKSSNPASNLVDEERIVSIVYHSTVALDRSGIIFKPYKGDNWSMTIKFQPPRFSCLPWFCGKPTLLMSPLVIDDFTELILSNFIAYEQSVPLDRCYFTSYAHAMDKLIDTQEDVAIQAEKVLVNQLYSNREVADMINKIGKNISVTDFLYSKEFEQMDKYYNASWPEIKRTYFSNPWNAFNLLVGIIVFLATVVAAIFAVLDYFR